MKIPRIMICGVSSGTGKTLITCGILQALVNRKKDVMAFKVGPDYIDPLFHRQIMGVDSRNIDTFFMGEETKNIFCNAACYSDISIIEGVMGYYDGLSGISTKASSYDVSLVTKTPVILVINAKGQSLSALAVIKGFLEYKEHSNIVGVILNRVSKQSFLLLKDIIETNLNVKALGYLPESDDFRLESRHLGLIMPKEISFLQSKIDELSKKIEETIDLDEIINIAENSEELAFKRKEKPTLKKCRIGIAMDKAFCFYYEDNIRLLEDLGCDIIYFSPLEDKCLPKDLSGIYLGGGYPELCALELSENVNMIESIKNSIEMGIPVIAECGGFLYLHEELEDESGIFYPLVGSIKARAYNAKKLVRFGYVELTAKKDNILCSKGEKIKAHEFHYWESEDCGQDFTAKKPIGNRSYECIETDQNIFAGFLHLYFASNENLAKNFVDACIAWANKRR